jgi:acyl-CoA dehydrogenase
MSGILSGYCGYTLAAFILIVLILGFNGAPLFLWTLFAAALAYGCGVTALGFWIPFAVVAVVFNLKPIRTLLVSSVVMKIFKALELMPAISETERTALEAGTVWVEKEIFSGKPDFKRLRSEDYPTLNAEEQAFVDNQCRKVCAMIDEWKIWQTRELPNEVWEYLKKERFLGMIVPKEYGGLGFSALANSEVVKIVSSRSLAVGITIMVPNSLGPAELLAHYGTEEQKKRWLPGLAVGKEVPCFALTEPSAGSDAGAITSTAEVFKDASGKLMLKLNWEKRWITLAAISTVHGLAVKVKDPQNLLGKGTELGITCVLLPSNTPGVQLGKRHDPLGVPFFNCPTRGKDVVVPAEESIIGGLDGIGQGWRMLTECLGAGRGISLPAQSTGSTQLSALLASAHGSVRKQFGTPVGRFEGVEEAMARIAGHAYLLEASRRYTCGAINKGMKPSVITAIAKYNSTEIARKSVTDCMDILGGTGITRGPRNLISNIHIAGPIGITVEGANILTRTLIIFGQGALRGHAHAYNMVQALEKSDASQFDRAFFGLVGGMVRNTFRSKMLSVTRGRLVFAPSGSGRAGKYYKKLAWASATFSIMTDVAMGALGGSLKFKEMITGRFADVLSWMYMGTAVLRRWEAEGKKEEDWPFVQYCMETAFLNMQKGFDGIFANMTAPGATWLFRGPIALWSRLNRFSEGPSDALTKKIARLIQTPGAQRDRICSGIYIPTDAGKEQIARLERTFLAVKAAEDTDRKVKKAVRAKQLPKIKGAALFQEALKKGVISQPEFDRLAEAEKLRWETIQVDEFTLEEYLQRK